MIQNQLVTERGIRSIGEEIGYEKGARMIRDFQSSFPNEIVSYVAGKEIIEKILSQPGCNGIRMYNALNEFGDKTTVFVGIDQHGKDLLEFSSISNTGQLQKTPGIVANRWKRSSQQEAIDEDFIWWGLD